MSIRDDVIRAVKEDDAERLKELLEGERALVRSKTPEGVSLLLLSQYHRSRQCREILLQLTPQLDLFEAAALGRVARLETLLEEAPERVSAFAADGFTALHLAGFFGQTEAAEVLLARGADSEAVARNAMKVRPLHSAVAGGSLPVAQQLLQKGADPNARQQGGWTPLMGAAVQGNEPLMQLLLQRGAEPAVRDEKGKSARDLALEHGQVKAAEFLAQQP